MENKIQIIIVDDNPTFLEGLKTYLSLENKFEVVASFTSGNSLLENINDYDPDLILLDVEMPGLTGIETARILNGYCTQLKLVAITLHHDNMYIKQLVEAGFRGFVNKNNITENLCRIMECVMRDELAFPEYL